MSGQLSSMKRPFILRRIDERPKPQTFLKRSPVGRMKRSYLGGLRVKPSPTNVTFVIILFHALATSITDIQVIKHKQNLKTTSHPFSFQSSPPWTFHHQQSGEPKENEQGRRGLITLGISEGRPPHFRNGDIPFSSLLLTLLFDSVVQNLGGESWNLLGKRRLDLSYLGSWHALTVHKIGGHSTLGLCVLLLHLTLLLIMHGNSNS